MDRFQRRALILSAVILILIGGGVFLLERFGRHARARVEEEVRRLKERGGSLSFSDLVPPPVPDEENGMLLFREACASLIKAKDEEWTALSALRSDPKGAAEEDAARIERWLESNRKCMEALEKGLDKSRFRVNIFYSDLFNINASIEDFFSWPGSFIGREANDLLTAEALLHARSGNHEEAFESCRRAIRFNRTMNTVPSLISHMVFISSESFALETLKGLLEEQRPSPEIYDRLLEELAAIKPFESMARALEGERCFIHAAYEVMQAGGSPPPWPPGKKSGEPGLISSIFRRPRCLLDLEHAWHLEEIGRYIEAVRKADPSLRVDSVKRTVPWYCLLWNSIASDSYMNDNFLDHARALQAILRLAGLTLRLIRHAERNTRLPSNLEELGLDPSACNDPFSGKPLIYERLEGGGFLLYSVGVNRKDDHGKEGASWDQGDIVWTRRAAGSSPRDAR